MTEKQIPARGQRRRYSCNQPMRRFRSEIHHHVAAEDDVESFGLPEARIVEGKVALLHCYGSANGCVQQEFATLGCEPAALDLRRRLAQGPRGVARALRPLERHGV